jgi:signal recognition particle GTPase
MRSAEQFNALPKLLISCIASYAGSCQGNSNLTPLAENPNSHKYQLVAVNSPDKIIFVGEALVGNEAVDQLTKFDRALRDFSSASGAGKGRGIDGMLVTKWDTVDDKVGHFEPGFRCTTD